MRVSDLPVARLERIFSPPGIPLVRKDSTLEAATAVILVRGRAGSGKTTLATALAHAIARDQSGVALFLSAEALGSEIRFKSAFLGLPEGSLHGWEQGRDRAPRGAILTQHIELTDSGRRAMDPGARRLAAFRAIEALLDGDQGDPARLPVKVVVLDGLLLPEGAPEAKDLRHEVIASLQELEARGVTPILVEEVGEHGLEWMPFTVDLVLELNLDEDPDTGKLIRRLRCPKSRYSLCRPGPHDFGLENGRPALWPDLLEVVAAGGSLDEGVTAADPPDFFWPGSVDGRYYVLSGPGVVASTYDDPEGNILRPHFHTPGTTTLKVVCGSETRLYRDSEEVAVVRENDGPHALAWAVLEQSRECNFVSIGQLPGLMRRRRFRLPLLHMLDALAGVGKRVCVHGSDHDLTNTDNLGAVLFAISRHPGRQLNTVPSPRFPAPSRWTSFPESLFDIRPSSTSDLDLASKIAVANRQIQEEARLSPVRPLPFVAMGISDAEVSVTFHGASTPLRTPLRPHPAATLAELALHYLIRHRLGQVDIADDKLLKIRACTPVIDSELGTLLAWVSTSIGDYWNASRIVSSNLKNDAPRRLDRLLWLCLRSRFVLTQRPLDDLMDALSGASNEEVQLCAAQVIDAMSLRGHFAEASAWLNNPGTGTDVAVRTYVLGMSRLIHGSDEARAKAIHDLRELSTDKDLTTTYLGHELMYNLGLAYAATGALETAEQCLKSIPGGSAFASGARAQMLRAALRGAKPPR